MAFTIYCDELSDELLARRYLRRDGLGSAEVRRLPTFARAPDVLRPLLRWERHDWVVVRDASIACTVEFSRHGYTGDNGFQRFARLFRSASLGAPTIYFTPFSRTRLNELDEGRQAPRNVAPELFQTLLRMSETYNVACVGLNWPTAHDGTAAPLTSPAAEPQLEQLCDLVRALATNDPTASREVVAEDYPDVLAAMRTQSAIPFSGTATRGMLRLPVPLTASRWIWEWLPNGYFGQGKADKVLAALALALEKERRVVGGGDRFWERDGEAWVLFLGYQWRPDPASGLIALAAETAERTGGPLIVVWPRVFYERDGDDRRSALQALREFRARGTGPVYDEAVRLGLDAKSIERFRDRVSIDDNQFGTFATNSKSGRILADVAAATVLGDVILLPR
jgi:hypothetical protein